MNESVLVFVLEEHWCINAAVTGGSITEKLSCGQSNIPPSQDRVASKNASRARKAMRLTTTLATKLTAQDAPWDTASNTFVHALRKKTEV